LTVVASELEADMVCGLLRSNGISCSRVAADASAEAVMPSWHEVRVDEVDYDRARELIDQRRSL
jgi:putative signal transducing protein